MADRSRIPAGISRFNAYLSNSDDFLAAVNPVTLTTNAERLGLTVLQSGGWHSRRANWSHNLYRRYSNPDLRTKTVTLTVRNFMTEFRSFAMPLLRQMAASPNASGEDEQVFNFKRFRKKMTRHTEPLSDECYVTIQPRGGGEIILSFRTAHHTGRASLAKGADSVQFACKVGDPAPQHYDELPALISTRARIVFNTGIYPAGVRFHIFCRWYNTRHPELAGAWSQLVSAMVL